MKRLCDWFNRHRDGTLDPKQQRQFESHMAVCEECRTRSFLLNNLVLIIKNQELPDLSDNPGQIADRAYEQCRSWDILFLSWLRPGPAWSALAMLAIFISFLWVLPLARQPDSSGDYEALLIQGDQDWSANADLTDAELERWLEEGGTAK